MTITIIPPVEQDETSPRFDFCQFPRAAKAASTDSRIAFSDYVRMGKISVKATRATRWIPAFAADDAKLRHVLREAAWHYAKLGRYRGTCPPDISLDELKRLCDARSKEWTLRYETRQFSGRATEYQTKLLGRHVLTNVKNGGWLEFRTRVCWLSWRMGWEANLIAEELFTTPCGVREILWRMCNVARSLGYETFKARSKSYQPEKHIKKAAKVRKPKADLVEIACLRGSGLSYTKIGAHLHVSTTLVMRSCQSVFGRTKLGKYRSFDYSEARQMIEAGKTLAFIARHFKVSGTAVWYAVRRAK
jgi:hypothetical protein